MILLTHSMKHKSCFYFVLQYKKRKSVRKETKNEENMSLV